jgi:hypothetical protein
MLVILLISIAVLSFANAVAAQAPANPIGPLLPDYELTAGKLVGIALLNDCSASMGTIESAPAGTINISVGRRVFGAASDGFGPRLSLEYSPEIGDGSPVETFVRNRRRYNWWPYFAASQGNELMMLHCSEASGPGGIRFMTNNRELFGSILRVIDEHKEIERDKNHILTLTQKLANNKDMLYVGALATYLFQRSSCCVDHAALLFSQLLKTGDIPDHFSWIAMGSVTSYLSRHGGGERKDLRAEVFRLILESATQKSDYTPIALTILSNISKSNPEELRQYLSPENANKILETIRGKTTNEADRLRFESLSTFLNNI